MTTMHTHRLALRHFFTTNLAHLEFDIHVLQLYYKNHMPCLP